MQAKVTADNNFPVKFRKAPKGDVICSIEQGTIVDILAQYDETWSEIQVNNQKGYMMTKFLAPVSTSTSDFKELKEELKKLLQLLDKLEAQK